MATKKYESMRIISLEGSVLYKNTEGFTASKDGKPDSGIFRGVLDESLDTLKLKEVYERHKEAIRFPYIEGKKRFCRAVVNLSFNRAKVLARLRHYRQTFKKKNGGNLPAFYKYIVGDESKDIGKKPHICNRRCHSFMIWWRIVLPELRTRKRFRFPNSSSWTRQMPVQTIPTKSRIL